MRALDVKSTSRTFPQIDRLIESASRSVEGLCHRRFAPTIDTRYFDWPSADNGSSFRLWLNNNELITLTSVTSGGTVLPAGNIFLEPADYGPPYNRIETNLGSTSAFISGSTMQRAIAVTGLFGYSDDSQFVGTSNGTITSSQNVLTIVADAAGVGTVLQIEDERIICTDRNMTSTSRTLSVDLPAQSNSTLVQTDGATIFPWEEVLIDGERMLVTDIVGNNLIVQRAYSGTVLAAHSATAVIYANRAMTVTRGALGTTAAQHANGTTWTSWVVPGPARTLCIAEVLNSFEQETAGYARVIGSGDNARNASGSGIQDARMQCYSVLGRHGRQRAV